MYPLHYLTGGAFGLDDNDKSATVFFCAQRRRGRMGGGENSYSSLPADFSLGLQCRNYVHNFFQRRIEHQGCTSDPVALTPATVHELDLTFVCLGL